MNGKVKSENGKLLSEFSEFSEYSDYSDFSDYSDYSDFRLQNKSI